MMITNHVNISQDEVVQKASTLPSFPVIVREILATIEDPNANLRTLVDYILHDPILLARVLSTANALAVKSGHLTGVIKDIFQATSLIGVSRVKHLAMIGSIANFVNELDGAHIPQYYLGHSLCVGVCCEELAYISPIPASFDSALVAGLLHDIGQIWFDRFYSNEFQAVLNESHVHKIAIEEIEQEQFGVNHTTVGLWLSEYWSLPQEICLAINYHHSPDSTLTQHQLIPLVHIAEVLSNALDLNHSDNNRVTTVSAASCKELGIAWDDKTFDLLGRIEARSKNVLNSYV